MEIDCSLLLSVINIMGKYEESRSKQTGGTDPPCSGEKDIKDAVNLYEISEQVCGVKPMEGYRKCRNHNNAGSP